MTFEKLIRADLMGAVKAAYPGLDLDAKGEPKVCRVYAAERDFERDNPRRYQLGTTESPKKLIVVQTTADVVVQATLEFHAEDQPDLEALFDALLADEDVVWTWRGYEVRVERYLQRTRLAKGDNALVDRVTVEYRAPFFKVKGIPVIEDASWFDGWVYDVVMPGEDEEPDE